MAEAVVRLRVDASGATSILNGVQNQTNKLQNSFNGLRTAIVRSGIVLVGRQAVNTSANFEKLNVRLGLLTKSSSDFAKSQKIAEMHRFWICAAKFGRCNRYYSKISTTWNIS